MLRINAASMRKYAAFIRGRRLIIFLFVSAAIYSRAAFIRGRRFIRVITVSLIQDIDINSITADGDCTLVSTNYYTLQENFSVMLSLIISCFNVNLKCL